MTRPRRVWYPGARYHVMNRGNRKEPIFWEKEDRVVYLFIMADVKDELGYELLAFCLMENHLHLLIETKDVHLSEIMHKINTRYSMYVNRKYGLVGRLFQDRFKAKNIMDIGYERELFRYIHMNPVVANLVWEPEEWVWSSYGFYVNSELSCEDKEIQKVCLQLLNVHRGLELFGGDLDTFIKYNTANIA